jgi:hypothetical protein
LYDACVTSEADTNAERVEDVRSPGPVARVVAWLGPPRGYVLTRWLILRLIGLIYVFAFLGLIVQGPGLLGSSGLTPIGAYAERLAEAGQGFWDVPSVFLLGGTSDGAIAAWAWLGLALSLAVLVGYANLPVLLVLWVIYGSFVRVGQTWFAFGWEIQLLETTLLCAFLAHPWDPRPLAARAPPVVSVVLMRWLVFRIMLGAGLIKLRGGACWTELTCLDFHFETQPIPNLLSPLFHHLPHAVLATGVVVNHVVELVAPWFVFGPRRLRLVAGAAMLGFQLVLILSGNLAFLNWLTVVPIVACFDDDALLRVLPARARAWVRARIPSPPAGVSAPRLGHGRAHQIAVGCFAALVAYKSLAVVENLASRRQAMNRSFDRLALVNTYGAFGSVTEQRYELVIEGTQAADPQAADAAWRAFELPCKPGDVARRPCVLGPYHRRLDWLIWFAAMHERPRDAWVLHLVWKLLDGDRTIRTLLAADPFGGERPTWVRVQRYRYRLAPYGANAWWTRELTDPDWLPPQSLDSPYLTNALRRYRWPSPSRKP